MVKCRICNEVKDITLFTKDKRRKMGYTTICKDCRKVRRKQSLPKYIKLLKGSKEDITHKIACRIRSAIKRGRYSTRKNDDLFEIVGCCYRFLYRHLINSFIEVYGRLPTDNDNLCISHRKPLSSVNSIKDIIALNHFTNLRYILAEDLIR